MVKRTLSDGELFAQSKNRHELNHLKMKLDEIKSEEIHSSEINRAERDRWRDFLRANSRNSGRSSLATGYDYNNDDLDSPRSADNGCDLQTVGKYQRQWALAYQVHSHNKIVKEMEQAGANKQKSLRSARLATSVSTCSSSSGEQAALSRCATAAMGVKRAKNKWENVRPKTSAEQLEVTDIHLYKEERVSSAPWLRKDHNYSPNISISLEDKTDASVSHSDKLYDSVTSMQALVRYKDTWRCSICGKEKLVANSDDRFAHTVLVYKGLNKILGNFQSKSTSALRDVNTSTEAKTEPQEPPDEKPSQRCQCHLKKSSVPEKSEKKISLTLNTSLASTRPSADENSRKISAATTQQYKRVLRRKDINYRPEEEKLTEKNQSSTLTTDKSNTLDLKTDASIEGDSARLPTRNTLKGNGEINEQSSSDIQILATDFMQHNNFNESTQDDTNETANQENTFQSNSESKENTESLSLKEENTVLKEAEIVTINHQTGDLLLEEPTSLANLLAETEGHKNIHSSDESPAENVKKSYLKKADGKVLTSNSHNGETKHHQRRNKIKSLNEQDRIAVIDNTQTKQVNESKTVASSDTNAVIYLKEGEMFFSRAAQTIKEIQTKRHEMNALVETTNKSQTKPRKYDLQSSRETAQNYTKDMNDKDILTNLDNVGAETETIGEDREHGYSSLSHTSDPHTPSLLTKRNQRSDPTNYSKLREREKSVVSSKHQRKATPTIVNETFNFLPDLTSGSALEQVLYSVQQEASADHISYSPAPQDREDIHSAMSKKSHIIPYRGGYHNIWKHKVEYRGVVIKNYISPHLRYKTAANDKYKRSLSVKWHPTGGAVVTVHEKPDKSRRIEVVFPKHARQKQLQQMIEENHRKLPNMGTFTADAQLRRRIDSFLKSVEPYCRR